MPTIVVLDGDRTGQELLVESLRVLEPEVSGFETELLHFDLSLTSRERSENGIVAEAAAAIREHGFGLKAATDTVPPLASPNAVLREGMGATVIVRRGVPLPGVTAAMGIKHPITIVRMGVGDAYGASERREQQINQKAYELDNLMLVDDEIAVRTETISRSVCRAVAEYSFQAAAREGAVVFGGPKWTVSPVYEGMLKEEMDAAAERHPSVGYQPQLIDATVALLYGAAAKTPLVIPALNRDGDILSDLVLPLFGSIASAESLIIALDREMQLQCILAEAPHGTAPLLEGKNVANPLAMLLAIAALCEQMPEEQSQRFGQQLRAASLDTVAAGVTTGDLGGSARTSEFVSEVIRRLI